MSRAIWIVLAKELLENVRDRRVILSAFFFGVLLAPVVFGLTTTIASKRAIENQDKPLELTVAGAELAPNLLRFLTENGVEIARAQLTADEAASAVRTGDPEMVLLIEEQYGRELAAGALGAPNFDSEWWAMLVAITIVTMTLGNILAIFQSNIKRMLAYSSIAQAGYTLIGLVALTPDGSGAAMFYLLMYVFTNVAAFGVVVLVSRETGSDDMKDFYGLSRRAPYLALAMLFA